MCMPLLRPLATNWRNRIWFPGWEFDSTLCKIVSYLHILQVSSVFTQYCECSFMSHIVLDVTDNGRVLKAINRGRVEIKLHVIEVISVFDDGSPVSGLRVRRHATNRHRHRLIVMSRDEIRSIPLHRCHRYHTCR